MDEILLFDDLLRDFLKFENASALEKENHHKDLSTSYKCCYNASEKSQMTLLLLLEKSSFKHQSQVLNQLEDLLARRKREQFEELELFLEGFDYLSKVVQLIYFKFLYKKYHLLSCKNNMIKALYFLIIVHIVSKNYFSLLIFVGIMRVQQFSNINYILSHMCVKEQIEPGIYDQNESIDDNFSFFAHTSSLGIPSSIIGATREVNPSQINFDREALPNYKKIDVGILSLFRTLIKPPKRQSSQNSKKGNNSFKHPKKEYIRCKLIRGHKRANRQIQENVLPNKTIHRFKLDDNESVRLWEALKEVYCRNQDVLRDLSLTENGPQTDGKSKRKLSNGPKSFNTPFCANYFKQPATKESFFYYTELLFCNLDPNVLIEKFEILCCPEGSEHDLSCNGKWSLLKRYINDLMIADLNIEPWFPQGYNREKITDKDLNDALKIDKNRDRDRRINEQQMILVEPALISDTNDFQLNETYDVGNYLQL